MRELRWDMQAGFTGDAADRVNLNVRTGSFTQLAITLATQARTLSKHTPRFQVLLDSIDGWIEKARQGVQGHLENL